MEDLYDALLNLSVVSRVFVFISLKYCICFDRAVRNTFVAKMR